MNDIVEIKGKNKRDYIVGVKWLTIFYDTQSQKRRKINDNIAALKHPCVVVVDHPAKDRCAVGLVELEKLNKRYSFTAAIASVYPDSIHVHEIAGRYWLFWIDNGMPMPLSESAFDSIEQIRASIETEIIPLVDDITFYGNRLLIPNEGLTFVDMDFETLQVSVRDFGKKFDQRYFSIKDKLTYAGMAAVISVAAYFAFNLYTSIQHERSIVAKREAEQRAKEKKIVSARSLFFDSLTNYSQSKPPRRLLESVNISIKDIPVIYEGWYIETINCMFDKYVCSFIWKTNSFGTYKQFFERFSKYRIDFSPKGDHILMELDFKEPSIIKGDGQRVYESIPNKIEFYNNHLSVLQYLQKSGLFSISVDEEKNTLTAPDSSAESIKDMSLGVTIRKWTLTGDGYYYLLDLIQYLPDISFSVESLTILYEEPRVGRDNQQNIERWTLRGTYVHKS